MARRRTTSRRSYARKSYSRSSYRSYRPKRRKARRRRSTRRSQTIKLVIEQAPASLATDPSVVSARQVKPKKAAF